jgi:hypothetical protein
METATAVIALGSDYDAAGAVTLKATLARVDGIGFVDYNYTNNRLTVRFDPDRMSLSELKGIVKREQKRQGPPAGRTRGPSSLSRRGFRSAIA